MNYKELKVKEMVRSTPSLVQKRSFLDTFQTSSEIQLLNVFMSISKLEKMAYKEPYKAVNRLMNLELHTSIIWQKAATEALERLTSHSLRCC